MIAGSRPSSASGANHTAPTTPPMRLSLAAVVRLYSVLE